MAYHFRDSDMALLNRLKKSAAVKNKSGYSRDVSAGFIADDLVDIVQDISGEIVILAGWGNQRMWIRDLNLRETDEAIKFIQIKMAKKQLEVAQNGTS